MPLSKIDSDSLTAPLTVPAGSAAAPAITTTGDTNTGIFFPAADTIAFAEGGAESMRIDSSGNVGIGITSPTRKLAVAGTWTNTGDYIMDSDSPQISWTSGTLRLATGGSNRVVIDTNGNVGIGTSSPTSALEVSKASVIGKFKSTSDNSTYLQIEANNGSGSQFYVGQDSSSGGSFGKGAYAAVVWQVGAYPMIFATSNSERARIESGGSLLMTTARSTARGRVDIPDTGGTQSVPLAVSRGGDAGTMVNFFSTNSTTTTIGTIGNSGNTNTTYNTSSDYRLKENITPMAGALDTVAALKPVTWNWKSTGADGQGFIAHELAEVVPDCVTGEKDAVDADGNPQYQGIDTSFLVATLTAAIQELKAIVDAQGAEIAALKGTP